MPSQDEVIVAVRREMLDLLRQQIQVLTSGLELTDSQLRECYDRQCRVQELRDTLEASLRPEHSQPLSEVSESESTAAFTVSSALHNILEPLRESPASL